MIKQEHITALKELADPKSFTDDPDIIAPHLREWRDKFYGETPLMLMPDTVERASSLIRYCHDNYIQIVPQGGNTGLVGGCTPGLEGRSQVLFSTKRMNKIHSVNTEDYTITAEAGVPIAALQQAASDKDRLFPLSLASEGSCTVGGVISTNAGGIHVLRYGTTRALVLGLEAVLPNGDIISTISGLRKDNTGYNLTQLLIGAEGTLGIVTKAIFKLYPPERQRYTYWLAVQEPTHALSLLSSLRDITGDRVSAFEILPQAGIDMVIKHIPGTTAPLAAPAPWHIVCDVASSSPDPALENRLEAWLEENMENGLIIDGAFASNMQQSKQFWKVRESMSEAQKHEGGSIKHDIAVPVSSVPEFLKTASKAVTDAFPGCRLTPFGHLGDGNIHFNVMQPPEANKAEFLANWETMNTLVHNITASMGGSISAEHGIGTLKREDLQRLKPASEISAMRAIKQALDPHNIMNPEVILTQD